MSGIGDAPWTGVHSAEALRATVQSAGVGVAIAGLDGRIIEVSAAFARLLGREPVQIAKMRWRDLIHPGDVAADLGLVGAILSGERDTYRVVERFVRPDGAIVWGDVNVGCVRDAAGEVTSLVSQVVDVTPEVLAQEALALSSARWRSVLDTFVEPSFICLPVRDASGTAVDLRVNYLNEQGAQLLNRQRADVLGRTMLDTFPHADDLGSVAKLVEPLDTDVPVRLVLEDLGATGMRGSFELSSYPFGDEIIIMVREITQQLRAEQALRESENRYRLLAQNAMDLVFSLDKKAVIEWVSPSVTALLGYRPDELVGQFGGMLIHPEDLPLLLAAAAEAREGIPAACRIRMVTSTGDSRWVEAVPRSLTDDDGELVGGVIGVRDIQVEVEAREALEHEIEFDALTGLAKRAVALLRIQEILDTRSSPDWALLCVGVDGMTAVNQAYTYAAGDAVLKAVADRLVGAAGASDRVARIAGDEFVVLMRDIVTPTDAANAARRILDAVHGAVDVDHTNIDVTVCAGIASSRGQGAQDLLRDATAAMRQASAKGSNRWEFLDGDVGEETRVVLKMQGELREALERGEIVPWFMPLADFGDGSIVGYEALVRWVREDGTVVGPDQFIDVAEGTGLILEIDRRMLSTVLDRMVNWPSELHFAVNVSAATLSSGTLDEWVRSELVRTGVRPERLNLEVTETSLFHVTASVQETMQSLADLGISWWVDDFGTGFSSISHLRDLPVAGLKLDQTFTSGITAHDSHATRLALGLAGLANGLGLSTVAEGVETAEQAALLAGQGWQLGQGWHFGKPAPDLR